MGLTRNGNYSIRVMAAYISDEESLPEWWVRGISHREKAFHRMMMAPNCYPCIEKVDVWWKTPTPPLVNILAARKFSENKISNFKFHISKLIFPFSLFHVTIIIIIIIQFRLPVHLPENALWRALRPVGHPRPMLRRKWQLWSMISYYN